MLQVGISDLLTFSRSLNMEYTVLLPDSNVAAIPDDVTANAMRLSCLTLARKSEIKNVFSVPTGVSREKIPLLF